MGAVCSAPTFALARRVNTGQSGAGADEQALVIEPFSNLAPVDVQLLLAMGVPAEAIINGTRLDLAMLEDLGWIVEPGSVSPPPLD
jgi:hypothetical protein